MVRNIGVSIVMPTYRQKELFSRAFDSLVNQSHSLIEIIIVDDNIESTYSDYVTTYLSNYSGIDVKYFKNSINLGSSKSRNYGVSKSTHSYITFLDDDDYYSSDKVERQLEYLIKESAEYSVCNIKLEHSNGLIDIRERKYLTKKEGLISKHLKFHITATSTFMYKKSLFNEVGGFPLTDLGDEFILMLNTVVVNSKFAHADFLGVTATVNHNHGLSSSSNKISSENDLIVFKKQYFDLITNKDIKYIYMRHNLVLSITYLKMRKFGKFLKHLSSSVFYNPVGIVNIIIGNDR